MVFDYCRKPVNRVNAAKIGITLQSFEGEVHRPYIEMSRSAAKWQFSSPRISIARPKGRPVLKSTGRRRPQMTLRYRADRRLPARDGRFDPTVAVTTRSRRGSIDFAHPSCIIAGARRFPRVVHSARISAKAVSRRTLMAALVISSVKERWIQGNVVQKENEFNWED
jgi:hypothetical protein